MSRRFLSLLLLVATFLCVAPDASSQSTSREYIRDHIDDWGECRNVAITRSNGDLAIMGRNGYACSNVPEELKKTLKELNEKKEFIDDVQLTEAGNWLVLYGKNSMKWSGVPADLEKSLYEVYKDNEMVRSVTFNDQGQWIMISDEYLRTSSSEITEWITKEMDTCGKVLTACMTDDAIFVVYEKGYKHNGYVSDLLIETLKATQFDVYRVKIAGRSWFIGDKSGKNYSFTM